ncbi:hypothetical protein FQZ97_789300 [compost metagenome]
MRGGAPAGERTGMRGQQRAGADRDQFEPAAFEALAAQPVQQRLRLGVVDRDGISGQPDQHDPGRAMPLRRQGREVGERNADRSDRRGSRAGEFDLEALGLARRTQPLVRDAQRLGRAGPVEDQAARHEHESHLDGRSHGRHVAGSAGSSACAGVHRRAKRSFSTVAVRALMLAAGSGVPSGWTMSKVSVASVTKSTV